MKRRIRLNEKHVIRLAMIISGQTAKDVAEKVGVVPTTIYAQLGRGECTMSMESVYKILDVMGFELVVRDKAGRFGCITFPIAEIPADKYEWKKIAAAEKIDAAAYRADIEGNKN